MTYLEWRNGNRQRLLFQDQLPKVEHNWWKWSKQSRKRERYWLAYFLILIVRLTRFLSCKWKDLPIGKPRLISRKHLDHTFEPQSYSRSKSLRHLRFSRTLEYLHRLDPICIKTTHRLSCVYKIVLYLQTSQCFRPRKFWFFPFRIVYFQSLVTLDCKHHQGEGNSLLQGP